MKPQLRDALENAGITADDYRAREKARQLVDTVNARLAALRVAVVCVTAHPVTNPRQPPTEILES